VVWFPLALATLPLHTSTGPAQCGFQPSPALPIFAPPSLPRRIVVCSHVQENSEPASACEKLKPLRVAGRNGLGVCGWRRRSKSFAWDIRKTDCRWARNSVYPCPTAAAHRSGSISQSLTSVERFSSPTSPAISVPGLPHHTMRNCALVP
jgi:hypothetical protein